MLFLEREAIDTPLIKCMRSVSMQRMVLESIPGSGLLPTPAGLGGGRTKEKEGNEEWERRALSEPQR